MLRILSRVVASMAVAAAMSGQVSGAAGTGPSASPVSLAPPDPAWSHTATMRTGLGWRDNVLLSPFAPLARGFAQAEIEALLLGSRGDWQVVALVNGDVTRFLSPPPETAGEHLWFGHGELRWQHWPSWRVTLKGDAFVQNSVLDLSETDALRTVLPARLRGAFATFVTRAKLPAGFTFEPLFQVRWTDYRNFGGDYDGLRGGGRLEWSRTERFAISAAWFEQRRAYAERPQYTAGGRPREGTRLRLWQRTFEAKATTQWDAGGRWRTSILGGRLENRDRSTGFFDYDQDRLGLEIDWDLGRWKASVAADTRRMEYLNQTVGAGITPPQRTASTLDVETRVEYKLGDAWAIFARYQRERTTSNEVGFSYLANTMSTGLQVDF